MGQGKVHKRDAGDPDSQSASIGPERLIHHTAVVPLPEWGLYPNPSPNEGFKQHETAPWKEGDHFHTETWRMGKISGTLKAEISVLASIQANI